MTRWIALVIATAAFSCVPCRAQQKIAEGEYHMRAAGADSARESTTMDHWILYTRKQGGGYRLESEVTAAAGTGVIVIQTEELTEQLSPIVINLRLYTREDTKKPFSALSCQFADEQITCKAGGEELPVAPEVEQRGPILLTVNKLENTDMMWMMAAAINRTQLHADQPHSDQSEAGSRQVPTLALHDGEDGAELAQTEIDTLHSGGKADVEINKIKVPAHLYSFENSKIKCWIAASGLLLKMENEDGSVIELKKFKQYKKLIPELP